MDEQLENADTLQDQDQPNDSSGILTALDEARSSFQPWSDQCKRIDDTWNAAKRIAAGAAYDDNEFDLFWASTEILKPAIYARPPVPVVTTRFSIRDAFTDHVSEMLERVLTTALTQTGIDDVMRGLRDDLILSGRGVPWITFDDEDGQRVIVEHLDRDDFLHEPARKWTEVGWVARAAWMTRDQMRERFSETSGDAYQNAGFIERDDVQKYGQTDRSAKAPVWEVWHRTDNRVYWVTAGVDVMLDDAEPHLDLSSFFPCPKPVYGSLKRRTLIPLPDYGRYETHLDQINELTGRIYGLLDQVRVKGLIPAGGDIAEAVEHALKANDDDAMFIPVPSAAFSQSSSGMVQFIPLDMFAQTIQGLIQSRTQLIQDFYELSGISDIMRGASDAQETLGAQQLKSQYGSIRIRDKVDALTGCARDICAIAGEIIASNFSGKTLMDMALMKMPTDADIKKQIAALDAQAKTAKEHLAMIAQQLEERAAQQQQIQPPPAATTPQPEAAS